MAQRVVTLDGLPVSQPLDTASPSRSLLKVLMAERKTMPALRSLRSTYPSGFVTAAMALQNWLSADGGPCSRRAPPGLPWT